MEPYLFFRRKPLGFSVRGNAEFIPARCENINEWLYAPVIAGVWEQKELWDGSYTLDDLADMHEILLVKTENQERAREAAEQRQRGSK